MVEKTINKKNKKILISFTGMVLSICFCFPFIAGYYSNGRKIEEIAQYTSNVVENNTENSRYLSITVGGTDESGPILDPYDEFHNLYGTFRQEQASFGSGINFYDEEKKDKTHFIYLNDYKGNNASYNLSLFYLGPVGSIEYNGHYKHYVYPFELMFVDNKNYDVSRYLAYISKTHADKLLESIGEAKGEEGKYSTEQYEKLIRQKVNMSIDGEVHEYVINNIYYEFNYYYSAMKEVFSDFILTSYFSPNKNELISERKNIYFMSEYPYQNQYYMEYINKAYSSKLYDVYINMNNVTKTLDKQKILNFYYSDLSNQSTNIFTTLIIFYYILLVSSLTLLIVFNFNFSIPGSLLLGLCSFIPYIVFYLIFKTTQSVALFTKVAGPNFFIGFVVLCVFLIVWHFIYRYVLKKGNSL